MIQVAQRAERFSRQMRFLGPTADDCFLHDRLPTMFIFIRGLSDSRAFRRKYAGKYTPEPPGNHANFVINFCQILFDPGIARIAPRRNRP